jgi:hypothetical protein
VAVETHTQTQDQKDFWHPSSFIKHLIEKREIPRHRTKTTDGEFESHFLDLSVLKLNVSLFTPFISWAKISGYRSVAYELLEQALPELEAKARASTAPFAVFVVGGRVHPAPSDELVRLFGKKSIALMDLETIQAVVNAPDRAKAWRELSATLVKYLGRDALSPYLPGRPAFGGRFFGRLDHLNKAAASYGSNVTIMGNRRIGKTSLLNEIRSRLVRDKDNVRTATVYGNKCHSTYDVCKEILEQLRPDLSNRLMLEPHLLDNLSTQVTVLPEKRNEDVAVFIDELDHVLEFDSRQGYALLHKLRATFEHERCRVFFAGFRRVMEAKSRLDTPLYNFTQSLYLAGLSKNETLDMINEPLLRLGVPIPESLTGVIVTETNGRPDLVQLFCAKVLEFYRNHGRAPDAQRLIDEMLSDQTFMDSVYSTFVKNTNSAERLACFALIRYAMKTSPNVEDYHFELKDLDAALKRVGARLQLPELETLAANLHTGGIITQLQAGRRKYKFAIRRLPDFCTRSDLDFLIEKAREDFDADPAAISVLMEPEEEDSVELLRDNVQ